MHSVTSPNASTLMATPATKRQNTFDLRSLAVTLKSLSQSIQENKPAEGESQSPSSTDSKPRPLRLLSFKHSSPKKSELVYCVPDLSLFLKAQKSFTSLAETSKQQSFHEQTALF